MPTPPTLHPAVLALQQQQLETQSHIAILYARQRHLRDWIARNATLSTYGPIAPTRPTSTAATASSPTTASASTPPSRASWLKLAKEYLPRIVAWLAEKYLLPILISVAMTSWAVMRRYGEAILAWAAGWWHWLAALVA